MTHSRKIEDYKELMASRGVSASTSWPPLWQLCSALGFELPPPLFMSPLFLFLLTGTTFGVLFSFGAWLLGNRGARSMPLSKAGWMALITGAAFGVAMTWYYGRLARKQQLGSWSAFGIARLRT
jgi:hypothetical protein